MDDQESSTSSQTQPAQQSSAQSPTPSLTPSPTSPGGPAARAVTGPFRKLGQETLRAVAVPVYPKQTRIIFQALDGKNYLPGQPRISLSAVPPSDDPESVSELLVYLREGHLTTELDESMPFTKYVFVSLQYAYEIISHEEKAGLTFYFRSKRPTIGTSTPCTPRQPMIARS